MGYDMVMVHKPEGEEEAYAAAREEWDNAVTIRDAFPEEEKGKWTEDEFRAGNFGNEPPANSSEAYKVAYKDAAQAYDKMRDAQRSYFRLNVWGMGEVCGFMSQAGMTYRAYAIGGQPEHPEDIPDEYWEWAERTEEGEEVAIPFPYTLSYFLNIKQKIEAHLSWSPKGRSGIPAHKFGSNDGWHVLPEECFYAAQMGKAMSDEDAFAMLNGAGNGWETPRGYDLWRRWLDFLDLASHHGGFKVY